MSRMIILFLMRQLHLTQQLCVRVCLLIQSSELMILFQLLGVSHHARTNSLCICADIDRYRGR